MRIIDESEIHEIGGGGFFYNLGYAVGSGVEAAGTAIGEAMANANNALKQYMYTGQSPY